MVASPLRWTTKDLDAMPDDGGWTRYEIVEGDLIVTRAPHFGHQRAGGKLYVELENWSHQTRLGEPIQAPGLVFSPMDAVIPDLVWISRGRLAEGLDTAGHLTIAPELVVEILSPGATNEHRDREVKRKLYSIHGVQEYWVVSWQLQTIEIYRRSPTQLQLVATLLSGDTLTSSLLPGFQVPLSRIFAD